MRRVIGCVVTLGLFGAVAAFTGGAVEAGDCFEPPGQGAPGDGDLRIRRPGGPWHGDGEYPPPLLALSAPRAPGEPAWYEVKVRNDSGIKQAMFVAGNPQNNGAELRFFKGDKNVTGQVMALGDISGGKKFKGIKPGESTPLLRMRVHSDSYISDPEYGTVFGRVKAYVPEGTCQQDHARGGVRLP
jgi:hypothetical protein